MHEFVSAAGVKKIAYYSLVRTQQQKKLLSDKAKLKIQVFNFAQQKGTRMAEQWNSCMCT